MEDIGLQYIDIVGHGQEVDLQGIEIEGNVLLYLFKYCNL